MYPVVSAPASSHGGRRSMPPEVIVLHHTGGTGTAQSQVAYLQNNPRGVSIHVFIDKDGTQYRMVDDDVIAYHVGNSVIGSIGNRKPNDMSLGIELMNTGSKTVPDPYPYEQVHSCGILVATWLKKYNAIHMITAHAGIDTQGKYDPHGFPWDVFWRALSVELCRE